MKRRNGRISIEHGIALLVNQRTVAVCVFYEGETKSGDTKEKLRVNVWQHDCEDE